MENTEKSPKLNWKSALNPVVIFATVTGVFYLGGFLKDATIAQEFGIINLSLNQPIQATIATGFIVMIQNLSEIYFVFLISVGSLLILYFRRTDQYQIFLAFQVQFGLVIVGILLIGGVINGMRSANDIKRDVLSGCFDNCRSYKTAGQTHFGRPISGNDKYLMIYTKTGVVVLQIEKIQSIHKEGMKASESHPLVERLNRRLQGY